MRLALTLALVLGACIPTQNDPTRYGVRRVHVVTGDQPGAFATSYLPTFDEALRDVGALGPTFVRTSARDLADVTVAHFDSGPRCELGAGRYTPIARLIEIDPVCTQGLLVQRAALAHEIGHWLGMRHVCRFAGEVQDCSPVGYGPAVMNPSLTYGDDAGPTLDSAYVGPVPTFQPTELDLAEYLRANP